MALFKYGKLPYMKNKPKFKLVVLTITLLLAIGIIFYMYIRYFDPNNIPPIFETDPDDPFKVIKMSMILF